MTQRFSALALLSLAAACASPPVDTSDPGRAERLARARELNAAGQHDQSLLITDELLAAHPEDRDALLVAADGNVGLFEAGRSNSKLVLIDAIADLEKALEIDPADPASWERLAELQLKNGAFEESRDAALQAAQRWRAMERAAAACRAVVLAADAEMQMFVDARRPEIDHGQKASEDTFALAQSVLSRLQWVKGCDPGTGYLKSGAIYRWLGQDLKALDEYERGIETVPNDASLHEALRTTFAGAGRLPECVAVYERLLERDPQNALLVWYLALARADIAYETRASGSNAAAAEAFGRATETFERYKELRPDHAANTNIWLAICDLARARLALVAGDLEKAQSYCNTAWERTPAVAEQRDDGTWAVMDGTYTYPQCVFEIGQALTAPSTRDALRDALAFYEPLLARHGGFWFLYNNAALTARDLGEGIAKAAQDDQLGEAERQQQLTEAMQLWEKSYSWYEKAVELHPNPDARTLNDCALVLVHHLHRDYDRARELLERAIEVGQPVVDALAADAPQEERALAEEPVGDAYYNLAVMLRSQGKPFADYEPLLRKSIEYHPYRQREAALLLASEGRSGRASAAPQAPDPAESGQDPAADQRRAAQLAAAREAAAPKAAAGDYDGALLALDEVARELQGYGPFHELMGVYSLRYADQARQSGGSPGQIDGLYADAISNLERAVAASGEAFEPRLELARAHVERGLDGDFAAAAAGAAELLTAIRTAGGVDTEIALRTHAVLATAAARVYVAAKQGGDDAPEQLAAARSSFRTLEQADRLDEVQVQTWAMLERWAGTPEQALDVVLRALQRDPESQYLLGQAVDVAHEVGRSDRAVEALRGRGDPSGLWYLGKARFHRSQELWADGQGSAAVEILGEALASFAAAKAGNPEFAETSDAWTALCLGRQGGYLIAADELDRAEEALLAAAATSPAQLEADLGGGESIKRGILVLGDRYVRAGDLAQAERLFRRAAEVAPQDVTFANNHGLFARDYATQLERSGDTTRARELYEASYAAYTRAAELEPDSVRLLNDRALLLIHHLGRDLDIAERLLREGIAKGEAQLRDAPEEGAERNDLEEAVGDCWQNLGTLQEKFSKDLAAAKASYEKSLTYHPGSERRSVTAALRRVARRLELAEKGEIPR